jgi:molybdate transport system substrate-binding protein
MPDHYNLIINMLHIQKTVCLLVMCLIVGSALAKEAPLVAIASNMSYVITDIADSFRQQTGIEAKLTFGSSGNFTRQIVQGAPFKIFLSADRKSVDFMLGNGIKLLADIKYARGRIGLFIPDNSGMFGSTDLAMAIKMLTHGRYKRLAIANPEHAPYGLAAQHALQNAGLWVIEKRRLLLAENAAQTMQIALSGNVDAAIVPASFIYLPELQNKGKFFLIPEQWHQPLQQYLVLLEGANADEKQFFDYMQEEYSHTVLQRYGYSLN